MQDARHLYRVHPDSPKWSYDPSQTQERNPPPNWVLDMIAERALNQGYTNKRNPVCSKCHIRKAVNGECGC